MGDLGLYLHFPFCVKKCSYCDFLSAPADEETKQLYAEAMVREIRGYAESMRGERVSSIFLGGGTPSLMAARSLRRIFRTIYECFDVDPKAEITMEMNPGTVNEAILNFAADYINRVSLGVQSANDRELELLGRIHTRHEAENSLRLLTHAGITNLNIDLMSGIPTQTEASWRETLDWAVGMDVPHISAYSLIVEEGTPFYALRERGKLPLPDEETERGMYYLTEELLGNAGLLRYEISNYARPGYECRHNLRYWQRGAYLGFGIGAASLYDHKRWHNTNNLRHYLEDSADPNRLVRELEQLDKRSEIEEFMFLGLRTMHGISEKAFFDAFGIEMKELYGKTLQSLVDAGSLQTTDEGYALTHNGIDISNRVLSEFLLD